MIRYRSWSALFTLASLALAAILWVRVTQLDRPTTAAAPPALPKRTTAAHRTASPARMRNLDAYSAIARRPLFSPTRRPTESPAPQSTSQPRKTPSRFVLSGVVIVSPDEKKIALLRESNSSSVLRLSEGETIGGWRIEKILPDRVIMRSGEESTEIELWNALPPPPKPAGAQRRQGAPQPRGLKLPTPMRKSVIQDKQ